MKTMILMLLVAFAADAQTQQGAKRNAIAQMNRDQVAAAARTNFAAACSLDVRWGQICAEIAKSEARLKEVKERLGEASNREGLRVMAKQSKGGLSPEMKALVKERAQEETTNAGLRLQKLNRESAIKESLQTGVLPAATSVETERRMTAEEITARNASSAAKRDAELKHHQALAAQGDAYGQLRMGERYLKGDGVEEDRALAMEYLSKAAAQGNESAKDTLKDITRSAAR